MTKKKPIPLKIGIGLIYTKLGFYALLLITFLIAGSSHSSESTNINTAIIDMMHLSEGNTSFIFGQLLGTIMIRALFLILGLVAIQRYNYKQVLILLGIHMLLVFIGGATPLLIPLALIFLSLGSSRTYLLHRNDQAETEL